MHPRRNLAPRPLIDLVLVAAVVGLLMAAYAVADWPWPVEFAAPAVQTDVSAPPATASIPVASVV